MFVEQRSTEWLEERAGNCTASRFADAIAFRKDGKPTADRQAYLMQLVTERLTGRPATNFVTQAMQWGIDNEIIAKQLVADRLDLEIDEAGFVRLPNLRVGCSPDGWLDFGKVVVEVKCPTSTTHAQTMLEGMSDEHKPQIQGQLWVTGAERALFVSFDPRMPVGLDLYHQWVDRDEEYIDELEKKVRDFLTEVDALEQKLRSRF
jgi:hypothetical protein